MSIIGRDYIVELYLREGRGAYCASVLLLSLLLHHSVSHACGMHKSCSSSAHV